MPFQIVNAENNRPVIRNGEPATFPDGALASAFLFVLKQEGDKRPLKIRPVNDPASDKVWQSRETLRMNDGTYVPPPFLTVDSGCGTGVWWQAAIGVYTARDLSHERYHFLHPCIGRAKYHYAHVSLEDKTKLAYTESSEKGHRNIKTRIKPGSYLTKHFSDVLTHDQIAMIVRDWQMKYDSAELKFAREPAEIVRIYQTGPRSCMSGAINEYSSKSSGHHPCEVYGLPDSDITMAYIQSKSGISARCLVWEAEKKHSRIYGDATLIKRELTALGYTAAPMYGAKIAKIKAGSKGFVMAYVDDASAVVDEGDHFKLWDENRRGNGKTLHDCRNTNGLTDHRTIIECSDCGEEIDEENATNIGDNTVCECCRGNYAYCEMASEYVPCDEIKEVRVRQNSRLGGRWYTQSWSNYARENYGFWCEYTEHYYHSDHSLIANDGSQFSTQALLDGIFVKIGEEYVHKDDINADIEPETITATIEG